MLAINSFQKMTDYIRLMKIEELKFIKFNLFENNIIFSYNIIVSKDYIFIQSKLILINI